MTETKNENKGLETFGAVLGTVTIGVGYVYLKKWISGLAAGTKFENEINQTIKLVDTLIGGLK